MHRYTSRVIIVNYNSKRLLSTPSSIIKPKRRFRILRFIRNTILLTISSGIVAFNLNLSELSTNFVGCTTVEENEIDKEAGIPLTDIVVLIRSAMLRSMIKSDPKKYYDKIIAKYPDLFLGYLFKARREFEEDDQDEANRLYDQAEKVFNTKNNPYSRSLAFMFPTSKDSFFQQQFEPIWTSIQKNRVWALSYLFTKGKVALDNQATIIKLDTTVATEPCIVILNPIQFNQELADKVHALGQVKALIANSGAHGASLAQSARYFPEAQIIGTNSVSRHDNPTLNWTSFLKEGDKPFGDELVPMKINGNFMNEFVFYHKPSNSLLSLTDNLLLNSTKREPEARLQEYSLAFGMYRGPTLSGITAAQSYHYMFTDDWKGYRASVHALIDLNAETLVLGHGGVIHGKQQVNQALTTGFRWVLDPKREPGRFERIYLVAHFLWDSAFGRRTRKFKN